MFGFALLIGFYLRVIDLNARPHENHVFRQTQTLSTIEDFARHGIDLLHPRTIYMGYPGTFVLELPVFQALAATVGKLGAPQVAVVRVLNILIRCRHHLAAVSGRQPVFWAIGGPVFRPDLLVAAAQRDLPPIHVD